MRPKPRGHFLQHTGRQNDARTGGSNEPNFHCFRKAILKGSWFYVSCKRWRQTARDRGRCLSAVGGGPGGVTHSCCAPAIVRTVRERHGTVMEAALPSWTPCRGSGTQASTQQTEELVSDQPPRMAKCPRSSRTALGWKYFSSIFGFVCVCVENT